MWSNHSALFLSCCCSMYLQFNQILLKLFGLSFCTGQSGLHFILLSSVWSKIGTREQNCLAHGGPSCCLGGVYCIGLLVRTSSDFRWWAQRLSMLLHLSDGMSQGMLPSIWSPHYAISASPSKKEKLKWYGKEIKKLFDRLRTWNLQCCHHVRANYFRVVHVTPARSHAIVIAARLPSKIRPLWSSTRLYIIQ